MQPSDTIQVRIMEISGVRIDFKEIMSRVRWALHEEIGDKPWRFESESRLGQLNLVIRVQVWHELVECLKDSVGKKDGTVRAEEAMAEAMRRGLEKENIRFRKKGFIASLTNSQYKIRKREIGYAAGPKTVGGYGAEDMGWCSPSMFADLLFAFDAIIPKIDSETAPILEEVLEAQRRIEREKMAERVRITAIKALVDKYLSPLGITYTANFDGDRVSLQLELLRRGSITAPLDELPGILEDTAAVMEALKPVTERKIFFTGRYCNIGNVPQYNIVDKDR